MIQCISFINTNLAPTKQIFWQQQTLFKWNALTLIFTLVPICNHNVLQLIPDGKISLFPLVLPTIVRKAGSIKQYSMGYYIMFAEQVW